MADMFDRVQFPFCCGIDVLGDFGDPDDSSVYEEKLVDLEDEYLAEHPKVGNVPANIFARFKKEAAEFVVKELVNDLAGEKRPLLLATTVPSQTHAIEALGLAGFVPMHWFRNTNTGTMVTLWGKGESLKPAPKRRKKGVKK